MISALPEIDAEISSKSAEQSKAKGSLKSLNVSEGGGFPCGAPGAILLVSLVEDSCPCQCLWPHVSRDLLSLDKHGKQATRLLEKMYQQECQGSAYSYCPQKYEFDCLSVDS